jgi:general secretion pathway protein G
VTVLDKEDKNVRTRNEDRKRRMSSAFTLVEMLLVLTIIGVLAAVVVASFAGKGKESRVIAARASIHAIGLAVEGYELDCGNYPSSLQALIRSSGEPNWKGPYILSSDVPVDPWATPFSYTPKENGFEIRSAGPDKAMGTSDDITN